MKSSSSPSSLSSPSTSPKLLSTGQAAKLCSVTPDTVLKWIKGGKLAARRTAGGHYRIQRSDLRFFERAQPEHGRVQYCWQYNGARQACVDCVVYQTRAHRCYEVRRLAPNAHVQLCSQSCEACDYYLRVHRQGTNVLIVSERESDALAMSQHRAASDLNIEATDCEYGCSALIETFRPDYVVVDCSLGTARTSKLLSKLKRDSRVPYVRIILAAIDEELPRDCNRDIFAQIRKLDIEDISACIRGAKEGPGGAC